MNGTLIMLALSSSQIRRGATRQQVQVQAPARVETMYLTKCMCTGEVYTCSTKAMIL